MERRKDIDGLRAIAILSVVLFHFWPNIFYSGFIGVDIFFVISGFLITTKINKSLRNNCFSFSKFYINRIKRLYPPMLLVIIFVLLFSYQFFFLNEFQNLLKEAFSSLLYISNVYFSNQSGYFDTSNELKPLLNLWSLSVEEQYYIIWPLILFLFFKYKKNNLFSSSVIMLISFTISLLLTKFYPTQGYFSIFSRFWELLLGGIIAFLPKKVFNFLFENKNKNEYLFFTGIFLLVISFLICDKEAFPGFKALLPTLSTFLIIITGNNSKYAQLIFGVSPAQFFGKISYSLYLWHWPLNSFLWIAEGLPNYVQKTYVLFISIVFSTLTYYLIEKRYCFETNKDKVKRIFKFCMSSSCVLIILFILNNLKILKFQSLEKRSEIISSSYRTRNSIYTKPDSCKIEQNTRAIILGDSFADHLQNGIIKNNLGTKLNVSYWFPGIPPIIGIDVYRDHYDSFEKKISQCLEKNLKSESLKYVILSSRFNFYLQKVRTYIDTDSVADVKFMNGKNQITREEGIRIGLSNIIDKIIKSGKTPILLAPLPEQNYRPEQCMRKTQLYPNKKCEIPISSYNRTNQKFNKIASTLKGMYSELMILDFSDIVCGEAFCSMLKDNKFIYSDNNHMSDFGSEVIVGYIKNKIEILKN